MKSLFIFIGILFLCYNNVYTQQNVTLLGSLNPYPSKAYSSLWGYTAPSGKEYALLSVSDGTSFIDISNPAKPVEVDFISGPTSTYSWREMKTHGHYAYVVSEGVGDGMGMQIIDLSFLPDSVSLIKSYTETFTTAHNIYIDNAYAYVVGTYPDGGGIHILNLEDPANPKETAYFSQAGYVHDLYVWNDTAYISAGDFYAIVDVKDKTNPSMVSQSPSIPGIYAHSGWLTEDKRYFLACEEFGQRDITIWDLKDRTEWDLAVNSWKAGDTPVHNIYIKGNYAHIAYYKAGYVVLDISNPRQPEKVGQYDTYDDSEGKANYAGAWNCYPFFNSGSVIISDMQTGLYIFDFLLDNNTSDTKNDVKTAPVDYILNQNYPNPFNPSTKITYEIPVQENVTLIVYDVLGNETAVLIDELKNPGKYEIELNADNFSSGIYFYTIRAGNFSDTKKIILLK